MKNDNDALSKEKPNESAIVESKTHSMKSVALIHDHNSMESEDLEESDENPPPD